MKKYIVIPVPLAVENKSFPLANYVRWILDNDKRFTSDAIGIRRAVRIEQAIGHGQDFWALEADDHGPLAQAAQQPSTPDGVPSYPVMPPRSLLPFIDAIVHAYDDPPNPHKADKRGNDKASAKA